MAWAKYFRLVVIVCNMGASWGTETPLRHIRAKALSYSHWCPAVEMKRASCVVQADSPQGQRAGRGLSGLRRAYRWRKQFVLRCCPGFMGPNCQQACFSCRGFATMTQRLNSVESLVQKMCNGLASSSGALTGLPVAASIQTTSGFGRRHQVTTVPTFQRLSRVQGRGNLGTDGASRPYFVKSAPELVVSLPGNAPLSDDDDDHLEPPGALQMDQKRGGGRQSRPETHPSLLGSSGVPTAPSGAKMRVNREKGAKTGKFSPEPDVGRVDDLDIEGEAPTASVENVWRHWDEESQARLSTVERKVLELERKLSALGPSMTDVDTILDYVTLVSRRLDALEADVMATASTSKSGRNSRGKQRDRARRVDDKNMNRKNNRRRRIANTNNKNKRQKFPRAKTKDAEEEMEKSMKREGNDVRETRGRQPSSRQTRQPPTNQRPHETSSPANLMFAYDKLRPKGEPQRRQREPQKSQRETERTQRETERTQRAQRRQLEPDRVQPEAPRLSSTCQNHCRGRNIPSPPPPPPLPEQQMLESAFGANDSSELVGAMTQGHEKFYRQLKAVLNKTSTSRIASPGKNQPSDSSPSLFNNNNNNDNDLNLNPSRTESSYETEPGTGRRHNIGNESAYNLSTHDEDTANVRLSLDGGSGEIDSRGWDSSDDDNNVVMAQSSHGRSLYCRRLLDVGLAGNVISAVLMVVVIRR